MVDGVIAYCSALVMQSHRTTGSTLRLLRQNREVISLKVMLSHLGFLLKNLTFLAQGIMVLQLSILTTLRGMPLV